MSSKELRKTFAPNFFSTEDIIASQAKIPCRTESGIKNFGFLDSTQESGSDLPPSTNVELPLWAAKAMSKQSRRFVTVELPKYYGTRFNEILKADPRVIDLNKMGPHFYQTGLQLCTLPNDETEVIGEILPEVLQKRLVAMNDSYSLNRELKVTEDDNTELGNSLRLHFMDPLERRLFNDSKTASEELDRWLKG